MAPRRAPAPPGVWSPGRQPGTGCSSTCSARAGSVWSWAVRSGPITVAYETWGQPTPTRDNAVLIEHALTGDSHAAGPAGPGHVTPGLVGPPDRAGRRHRHRPVVGDLPQHPRRLPGDDRAGLGVDPTGSPWGSRFPSITIRDQVAVEAALADALGIDSGPR